MTIKDRIAKLYPLVAEHGSDAQSVDYAFSVMELSDLIQSQDQDQATRATTKPSKGYSILKLFKAFQFALTLRNASKTQS